MRTERRLAIVSEESEAGASVQAGAEHAIAALKALAQPTRMEIFRMVHAHAEGLPARVIAARVGGPHSVTSMHLAVLARARLLLGRRTAGVVTYRSNPAAIEALVAHLTNGRGPFALPWGELGEDAGDDPGGEGTASARASAPPPPRRDTATESDATQVG